MQYTVKSGDTISKIARDVLGNMNLWPQIAASNNITAPYTIFPGQSLQLPEMAISIPTVTPRTTPQVFTPGTGTDFMSLIKKYWWVGALLIIAVPILMQNKKR